MVFIVSSELCEPKRFTQRLEKLKGSIFKKSNQINSNVTIRTWVLSTEWPITGLLSGWENGGGPRLF